MLRWWRNRQSRKAAEREARKAKAFSGAMDAFGYSSKKCSDAWHELEFNLPLYNERNPWEPERPDVVTRFPLVQGRTWEDE